MSTITYQRLVFLIVRGGAVAVFILMVAMAVATLADCSMRLGWGWDCKAWPDIALIAGAAVAVFIGATAMNAIFSKFS